MSKIKRIVAVITLLVLTACATEKNHPAREVPPMPTAAMPDTTSEPGNAPAAPVSTPAPVLAAPMPSPPPRTAARMPEKATKKNGAGIYHAK